MAPHEDPIFEPQNLFAAISKVGILGNCPLLDGEFQGGECRVFKVSFKDKESVAIRVPHPNNESSHADAIALIQIEVRILENLQANSFPWAPRYLGASLTFDNPIKRPFIVLTWAEGLPLNWDENHPPRPLRDSLLRQIALIQLSLIQCTLQNGSTTATAYFGRRLRNRLRRVREGGIPELTEKDCLDQQALLDLVLDGDGNSTLFAIDHGDIKPGNIIVDRNHNIICIIDWGFAELVPIVRAARLPRFLWQANLATFCLSRTVLKDRLAYTLSLSPNDSPEALFMQRCQTAENVDFRTLYLESISSKGIHLAMARRGWLIDRALLGNSGEQTLADRGT